MAQVAQKKKEKLTPLDGLVVDLYTRVETPLDYANLSTEEHMESIAAIHRMLHQVQKHEKDRVAKTAANNPPLASDEARLQELKNWLHEQGVDLSGLELKSGLPEGSGVVAGKDFQSGDMVATIPYSLCMTVLTAIQSKTDVAIIFALDKWFQAVPSLALTMHLLFEKHRAQPSSKWAGYIRSLPGQVSLQDTNLHGPVTLLLPLAFSMEAIDELRGTTALVEYHRMIRTVAKQYCRARTVLHQLSIHSKAIEAAASEWFSFAEFRWAVSTVMMRQNPLPTLPHAEPGKAAPDLPADLGTTLALIPLLDLFNHEEGPITSHCDTGSYKVEVSAKRDFKAGEQIFVSYGARPNAMLLLYNGFLPKENSRDRTRVPVSLGESDPLYAKKAALLKWLDLPSLAELDVFADGTPSPPLRTWLRVAAIKEELELTNELRDAIAQKTKETSAMLARHKTNGDAAESISGAEGASKDAASKKEACEEVANGHGQADNHGSGECAEAKKMGDVLNLDAAQLDLFAEACNARLKALTEGRESSKDSVDGSKKGAGEPKGLGLGLKKGGGNKSEKSECLVREIELTRKLREGEVHIIQNALLLVKMRKAALH